MFYISKFSSISLIIVVLVEVVGVGFIEVLSKEVGDIYLEIVVDYCDIGSLK